MISDILANYKEMKSLYMINIEEIVSLAENAKLLTADIFFISHILFNRNTVNFGNTLVQGFQSQHAE